MAEGLLLALLPPPELAARVRAFRAAHGIVDAAAEPHVTLLRSGADLVRAQWEQAGHRLAGQLTAPEVALGGARVFGNGAALYLAVSLQGDATLPEALRRVAADLHARPGRSLHLSVALNRRGVDLGALLPPARRAFADLETTPLCWTPPALTLLHKAGVGAAYRPVQAWAFAH